MKKAFLTIHIFLLNACIAVSNSYACTVCFYGDPSQAANKGLRAGVLILLAFIVVVLVLFARFFIQVNRRAQSVGTDN